MGVQNDARGDGHVSVDDRLQEAIRAVELPSDGIVSARQHNALKRVVEHLRENGEAGGNELRQVGWSHKLGEVSKGRGQWWSRAVEPYLRDAIPGIEHKGGGLYSFDPNGVTRDRPSPPDPSDVIHPSEEQVEAALDTVDYPGDGSTPGRHRASLQTAWKYLREQGSATREPIRQEAFIPQNMNNPEQGYFSSRRQWWVLWGRPTLLSLPGVRPPVIPGEKWVYVGVESGTEPV